MNSGGKNMRVLENVQPQKVFYYFEESHTVPIIQKPSVTIA